MSSQRLPGKPLALIGTRPMIAHVVARALASKIGPVIVATDEPRIAAAAEGAGAAAILTRADHPSGSDRVAEAIARLDPDRHHDLVINVQGDEPELDPSALRQLAAMIAGSDADIGTLATSFRDEIERADPNAVKLIGRRRGADRVLADTFTRHISDQFTRHISDQAIDCWRHIGVYAYRRAALEAFVALPPRRNEERERLEQLRALDAGMRIEAALVESAWRGVDTPADLAAVRKRFAARGCAGDQDQ